MIYFHFCEAYLQNTNNQFDKIVRKKLNEYSNRETLRGINSVASYTGKIFVLNISNPHLRVILEEQRISLDDTETPYIVYFVRDILNMKTTYNWLQYYVQIRDGKWLEYHPLNQEEVDRAIASLNETNTSTELSKPFPPSSLVEWHNSYKLKVEYDIYESEEWVKFALNNSPEDGMKDDEAKLFKLAIEQLANANFNSNVKYTTLTTTANYEVKEIEYNDVCVFYLEIIFPSEESPIFLLLNGANRTTQSNYYNRVREDLLNYDKTIDNVETVQRIALRAYPKWALSNPDLWKAIQKNSETGNLSLLPEQTVFLKEFTFPKYINGQAGSGKSTMLYYLFANTYYFKCFDEIHGDIIFLTENENLLKHTKKSIIELLQCNPEFELSFEDISNVDKHFVSFKEFLLSFIPENIDQFRNDKYLDFSKFKILYEASTVQNYIKQKYSAELVWFALSTYIYGYDIDDNITSENYDEKMPSEGKNLISKEEFGTIEKEIIPFYKRLIENDGYWDKIKIIKYIKDNSYDEKVFDVIFCDEAQDFSRVELNFILSLSNYLQYDLSQTEQVPIVFAGDALQTVNPTGFRAAEVKDMLYSELKQIAGFNLDTDNIEYAPEYNYRSSQPIVNVANAIQYWRKKHFNAAIKKPQIAKRPEFRKDSHLNIFLNFTTINENSDDLINKLKYKIFIIPVNYDEKESYIQDNKILSYFPEANIKTAVEAKGIDYEQVVIFGFGEYNEKIESSEEYEKRFFYNKLYVAVTRAQFELIILDSEDSEENFWKKLTTFYANSTWSQHSEVNSRDISDTIVFGANTIPQIIQSTPEMAIINANKDKDQGLFTKNPFLLRIAANQFLKLGDKKEHFICLGYMHKFKEEWIDAAKYFSKKEVGSSGVPLATEVYWEGKLLDEFLNFSIKEETEDNNIKETLAELVLFNTIEFSAIRSLYESRSKIRGILYSTPWKLDIIGSLLSHLQVSSDESVRILIDIFEEICNNDFTEVWKTIGVKNYNIKRYDYAIESFEKIHDYGEFYIKSKIELSKFHQNIVELVFWYGNLLKETKQTDAQYHEYKEIIISTFKSNKELFLNSKISLPYSLLYILECYIDDFQTSNKNEVLELINFIEKCYNNNKELLDFYYSVLIDNNLSPTLYQFILNRWARAHYINNQDLPQLNETYKQISLKHKTKYHSFTLHEINQIPKQPTDLIGEPPKHIKNIRIKNFRKFEEVSIENLGLINLVVGDNNIGKTSFLESLLFTSKKKKFLERLAFSYIERKNLFPTSILNSDSPKHTYTLDKEFVKDFINRDHQTSPIEYVIEDSRAQWIFKFQFNSVKDEDSNGDLIQFSETDLNLLNDINYYDSIKNPLIAYGKGFGIELARVYYEEIMSKPEVESKFIESMRLFIPNIRRVIANTATGNIHIYEENKPNEAIPLHQFGEGANKLFRILIYLVIHRGKRVLIDEIDAGIHHTRFNEFWEIIISASILNNTQLICTTHNEECIIYFADVLSNQDTETQNKSRVIQLKTVSKNLKIRSYEFDDFYQAIEDNYELRGGL